MQTAIPTGQKVQQMLGWMKTSMPFGIKGIVGAVVIIALLGFLIFTNIHWSILGGTVVLGLLVYRYIRNRKNRMVKRFVAKVSKFPEVKAITFSDSLLTVIVEKAQAKLYIRINSLIDSMNKKLYFGESLKAAVRDDLSEEDFQRILRAPGVLYVRDDVILES